VQVAQIAQQRRFGYRTQIQHQRAGANLPRQTAGMQGDHVAFQRRMHRDRLNRLIQIQHSRLTDTPRRERHRLPVQAHDPRQNMRQQRPRQHRVGFPWPSQRDFHQQPWFPRRRPPPDTQYAGIAPGRPIAGQHDMRQGVQFAPSRIIHRRARVREIFVNARPIDFRQSAPILQIGQPEPRSRQ